MADEYTWHKTNQPAETEFQFSSRQFTFVPDSNNGSYPNSQVTFDLASLSNSGKYVDFAQSYLTVPLVLHTNFGTATTATRENTFAHSLKNGFHHLISSLSVEITNNQVVNLTNLSNLDINFKLLTTSSLEDARALESTMGFVKDSAESITYVGSAADNMYGVGECNNNIADALFAPANGWGASSLAVNKGRQQRMVNTSFDSAGSAGNFTDTNKCTAVGKTYTSQNTTDILTYVIATIPLRFLHDIFAKLPLAKGIYMRLILNLNAQCQVTTTTTTAGIRFSTGLTSSSQNNLIPFMISPPGTGYGLVPSTAATTTIKTSLGIARSFFNTATTHPAMTTCRIYACMYELSPPYEIQYLTNVPTKKVLYNDILSFNIPAVASGGQVSQILTNGISRARYLLICPFLSSAINMSGSAKDATFGATTAVTGFTATSTLASPFSSAPGTCCPYAFVNNFNVLISGSNLYQSSINYRYEHWLQEISKANSVNGGLSLGMNSGLLSQQEYETGYNFIYCDLSRKISQASDDISRSIQVVFNNQSACSVEYVCIIGYEREISVSTSTGSLITN
jgi:hypothetical protein